MKWNIWCLKVYTNLKTFCHFVLVIFFKFKFEPFSIQKRISFELRSATLESQWWHYHRKSESKEECHSDANWRNMLLNITSSLFTIPCWNVNWKIDKQNMNTMISKQTWIKWHTYRNPFVVAMKWTDALHFRHWFLYVHCVLLSNMEIFSHFSKQLTQCDFPFVSAWFGSMFNAHLDWRRKRHIKIFSYKNSLNGFRALVQFYSWSNNVRIFIRMICKEFKWMCTEARHFRIMILCTNIPLC